jgi:hypothetical protein
VAESTVDDVIRADGRHIRVEEEPLLGLAFLLPEDGYSCDIVRGIPTGIVEFLSPLSPLCRLTPNPNAAGYWTIFFHDPMRSPSAMSGRSFAAAFNNTMSGSGHVGPGTPGSVMSDRHSLMSQNNNLMSPSTSNQGGMMMGGGGGGFNTSHLMPPSNPHPGRQYEPEVQTIKLQKISGGLGLSIVAAKVSTRDEKYCFPIHASKLKQPLRVSMKLCLCCLHSCCSLIFWQVYAFGERKAVKVNDCFIQFRK